MLGKKQLIKKSPASPRYVEVYEAIRHDLLIGTFRKGQQLPPTPALLKQYNINSSTLQRAMHLLVRDGFIERTPRRGTFVKKIPQGPRIALLAGDDLLAPAADFSRIMVRSIKDASMAFEWVLEVFDAVRNPIPGHQKKIAEAFARQHMDQPFQGVIELKLGPEAISTTVAATHIHGIGLGPKTRFDPLELDVNHMVLTCMNWFHQRGIDDLYVLQSRNGIPFGPDEETFLKRAAQAAGIRLTGIDLNTLEPGADPTAVAFYHAERALQMSGPNTGFYCSEEGMARGIAEAAVHRGVQPPSMLVSASDAAPRHLIPFSVYQIPAAEIAEALINRIDEKIHGNALGEPEPLGGILIPARPADPGPDDAFSRISF